MLNGCFALEDVVFVRQSHPFICQFLAVEDVQRFEDAEEEGNPVQSFVAECLPVAFFQGLEGLACV